MMNDSDLLTVTLTASEWNAVLTQLAEAPYKAVSALIHKIQDQCLTSPTVRADVAQETAHAPD